MAITVNTSKYLKIFVLLVIIVILVPAVSASNIMFTSLTGKLILGKNNSESTQIPIWYRYNQNTTLNLKSDPIPYSESSTACGNCNANWDALLNIPIQPHFNMTTNLPKPSLDSILFSGTSTTCGMCGNSFNNLHFLPI
jgi:hypothetical protein